MVNVDLEATFPGSATVRWNDAISRSWTDQLLYKECL